MIFLLILLFFFPLPLRAAEKEGPKTNPIELIHSLSQSYEKINDYTAILTKQERIRGILHREENMLFKFKKPFRIYMKWLKGPGEGREILYDPRENEGKMVIKPHGLIALIVPIIYIEPNNPLVKSKSRHTIKEAGLGVAIKSLIDQYDLAYKQGDLKIDFKGEEIKEERTCLKMEASFPEGKGYYAGRIITFIDKELNLPAHISIYDWKDNLLETASYTQLKLNVGLTDNDFSPRNPSYGFKVK